MHEWLSGGVSPCQGEGRGFESRLVLGFSPDNYILSLFQKLFRSKRHSFVEDIYKRFFGQRVLHEWLSGGVSPCQGEGRGFESRLVLFLILLFRKLRKYSARRQSRMVFRMIFRIAVNSNSGDVFGC